MVPFKSTKIADISVTFGTIYNGLVPLLTVKLKLNGIIFDGVFCFPLRIPAYQVR